MPDRNQLSEKDEKLIEACINRNEAAIKEFCDCFRPIISPITMNFVKNKEEAKDFAQEILWKCIEKMKEHRPTQNLQAWVKKLASNHCYDIYRKNKSKEVIYDKSMAVIDQYGDPVGIPPGSRKYYEKSDDYINIDALYKREFPHKTRKDIEYSIWLIEIFYKLIEKIKLNPTKYELISRIEKLIDKAKKDSNRIMGRISKETIGNFRSLRAILPDELSDSEKRRLNKLKKREDLIGLHSTLNESFKIVMLELDSVISRSVLNSVVGTSLTSKYWRVRHLYNFALKLRTMRIKSPRLIYCIWIKSKDFRKGKVANPKKMQLAFLYYKRKTKGTDQEFLFESIREDLSNYESIRQSKYKVASNEKLLNEIIDFIYKCSFIYKRE